MQKAGKSLVTARSTAGWTRLRAMIETEVIRALNHAVALHRPCVLAVEKLDFRGSGIGVRMNRLRTNCGQGVVAEPAYTWKTCSSRGGHVDARQRSGETFQCRHCGRKLHSDVNGARNIAAAWCTFTQIRVVAPGPECHAPRSGPALRREHDRPRSGLTTTTGKAGRKGECLGPKADQALLEAPLGAPEREVGWTAECRKCWICSSCILSTALIATCPRASLPCLATGLICRRKGKIASMTSIREPCFPASPRMPRRPFAARADTDDAQRLSASGVSGAEGQEHLPAQSRGTEGRKVRSVMIAGAARRCRRERRQIRRPAQIPMAATPAARRIVPSAVASR